MKKLRVNVTGMLFMNKEVFQVFKSFFELLLTESQVDYCASRSHLVE